MIIEATALLGLPVATSQAVELGRVCGWAFDGRRARVAALKVNRKGPDALLPWMEISHIDRQVVVSDLPVIPKESDALVQLARSTGAIIGVRAKTEGGRGLGRINDLFLEAETGLIARFYIRNFLQDRLIPRQFLVAITPKDIIFKYVVETPVFDTVAAEAPAGS